MTKSCQPRFPATRYGNDNSIGQQATASQPEFDQWEV
jgi:hypothetical protein